jgi:hypothetical protein
MPGFLSLCPRADKIRASLEWTRFHAHIPDAAGLPIVSMIGWAVDAGPFESKEEAKHARATMHNGPRLFSEIVYRESVSGK